MNVLSLFDGMSCGQIAFDKLGIKFDGVNNKYFASEIKKHAIETTQLNYPNTIQLGDVTKIKASDLLTKRENYSNLKRVKKRYGKLPLGTIIFKDKTFTIDENIRNFYQIELERLHNIPEGYTRNLTVNKAHDLIGDGWTVDVIVHIFSFIDLANFDLTQK